MPNILISLNVSLSLFLTLSPLCYYIETNKLKYLVLIYVPYSYIYIYTLLKYIHIYAYICILLKYIHIILLKIFNHYKLSSMMKC